MIVKNEERVLARCLDSLQGIYDELVIVDTGSTDSTKEIAAHYTDKIYDFEWVFDFSAARNFAFSKATCDYIYSVDADEVLDDLNRDRFLVLKDKLLTEIDIVQMKYGNQLHHGTVYNFNEELRPKLFKRLRPFVWEEPVHEQVRLSPVIFDSDIVITHMPENNHSGRDLAIFGRQIEEGHVLSKRLFDMFAREMYLCGEGEEFRRYTAYFEAAVADTSRSADEVKEACVISAKAARLDGDVVRFFKYATKLMVDDPGSEICIEMGRIYEDKGDLEEAAIWYYNAGFETLPLMCVKAANEEAAAGLVSVYKKMGVPEAADSFVADIEARIRSMNPEGDL